ncbi:hypothetical protein [Duganella sp. LjRoot269]|uniref:hypothetical protein n=1 Tax=Duganella sp. LjRoot269 TaxID=3342305 RepID=UPI003ED0E8BE
MTEAWAGWGVVQAGISAVTGLAGVWLGGHLTNSREAEREESERRHAACYLATLVLAHLDRFSEGCVDVAFDDGTSEGQPAGDRGYHQTTTSAPVFDPLELEVQWNAISPELMYELLNLPHRTRELQRYLNMDPGFEDPPDFVEYFWTRQCEFAQLGLDVIDLAVRLRSYAGLPPPSPGPSGRRRDEVLRERRDKLARDRRENEARRAAEAMPLPVLADAARHHD